MSIPLHKFGSTTFAKVRNSNELRQVLDKSLRESETIIIKPNWVSTDPAEFTDSDTLRMLFEVLDARIIVVESYCLGRAMNILKDGMSFSVGDRAVNWRWLLLGEGWTWLIKNPDWGWFKNGEHWEHLKKEEQAFLDRLGFSELFEKFNVTYLNITEEVWNGRTANPDDIKGLVESRFKPVQVDKLYGLVPQKLYDLRGSTFISLARLKMYASFSMKNLFGMIPDPLRPWWHGFGNRLSAQNILGINKVYHSIFPMFGICEAIKGIAYTHPYGVYEGIYSGRYNITEGKGVIAFGSNLVELDTILLGITDPSQRNIVEAINQAPISQAQDEFGVVDRGLIAEASNKVQKWLSP